MITLYVGKSAAGKDTFFHKMVSCGIKPVVSYTTRPMRVGEVDGVDYHFTDRESFSEKVSAGEIFEYRSYQTNFNGKKDVWYYGSPKVNPAEDYVAITDIQGAKAYINEYGSENLTIVYVYCEDEERKRRAMLRGSFSIDEWERRATDDEVKFNLETIGELVKLLGKPITLLNNTGDKPAFSTI